MSKVKDITIEDVVEMCNGRLISGNKDTILENFCQDTRVIKPGDVFIGIEGEKYNGNDMYEEAIKNGAKACILQKVIIPDNIKDRYPDVAIVIVEDTIRTLQKLATYKRSMYDIPVIAITGSVRKNKYKRYCSKCCIKRI